MTLHILHMLRSQKRHISFHTPGHKRAGMDITELPYSDDLSDPKGVLALAQADAAHILGAKESFFLTDGSTCGVFSMMYALRSRGCRHICVPTYAHKSVFHACEALGLDPVLLAQESAQSIPSSASLSNDMLLRLRAQRSSFLPEYPNSCSAPRSFVDDMVSSAPKHSAMSTHSKVFSQDMNIPIMSPAGRRGTRRLPH